MMTAIEFSFVQPRCISTIVHLTATATATAAATAGVTATAPAATAPVATIVESNGITTEDAIDSDCIFFRPACYMLHQSYKRQFVPRGNGLQGRKQSQLV